MGLEELSLGVSNTEFQEENPVCVRKGDDSFEKEQDRERECVTKPRRQRAPVLLAAAAVIWGLARLYLGDWGSGVLGRDAGSWSYWLSTLSLRSPHV